MRLIVNWDPLQYPCIPGFNVIPRIGSILAVSESFYGSCDVHECEGYLYQMSSFSYKYL